MNADDITKIIEALKSFAVVMIVLGGAIYVATHSGAVPTEYGSQLISAAVVMATYYTTGRQIRGAQACATGNSGQ